ncbi:hypothetical protein [Paractinoplanes lichenicola]|uniref:Type II toxin-antitoxin system PemK/MazF family toxin n=1 Tax=Paractinoplanes lichenicola TaxID=2802976 RepID=A0ABS1W4V7_9ACTN|nr:hypothetical protein [Actinoplanes lichenicola]MBL7261759.1 hypothetical protein [Actinoplanes lichenicola]
MERGEIWMADVDGPVPIVLLSSDPTDGETEFRGMQIVPAATPEQRRGFVFLDPAELDQVEWSSRPAAEPIAGIEVPIGEEEGLTPAGVLRVALPRDGQIFCTWEVTVTADHLVDRVGRLSAGKLRMVSEALRLSGPGPG